MQEHAAAPLDPRSEFQSATAGEAKSKASAAT